jgi:radical SAM superfamily enzyme YgiQ (UPF0313 family)
MAAVVHYPLAGTTLKRAGCSQVSFGFESMDQKILDSINKKVTVAQNEQAAALCEKHDMDYGGTSFMVGYIDESEEEMRKTADFCRKHYLRYEPHYMTPFPGTELYRYALKEGLIDNELAYLKKLALQGNTNHLLINVTKHLRDEELIALRAKYIFYTSPYRKMGKVSPQKIVERLGILLRLPPALIANNVAREVKRMAGFRATTESHAAKDPRNSNVWE